MDGTLLNPQGQLPPDLRELTLRARELGCSLVPASGRQLATLRAMFPDFGDFIAENGSVVMRGGEVTATFPIPEDSVQRVREVSASLEVEHTMILCRADGAFIEKDIPDTARAEVSKYYHAVTWVDSLEEVSNNEIIKIAIHCEAGTEAHIAAPVTAALTDENVAVSGKVWLDVMADGVDKGAALAAMAGLSDVPMEHTVAFGDYLNDLGMLQTAGLAVAMENAHPALKEEADIIAPSNADFGVSTVLHKLFDSCSR